MAEGQSPQSPSTAVPPFPSHARGRAAQTLLLGSSRPSAWPGPPHRRRPRWAGSGAAVIGSGSASRRACAHAFSRCGRRRGGGRRRRPRRRSCRGRGGRGGAAAAHCTERQAAPPPQRWRPGRLPSGGVWRRSARPAAVQQAVQNLRNTLQGALHGDRRRAQPLLPGALPTRAPVPARWAGLHLRAHALHATPLPSRRAAVRARVLAAAQRCAWGLLSRQATPPQRVPYRRTFCLRAAWAAAGAPPGPAFGAERAACAPPGRCQCAAARQLLCDAR